MVDVILITRRRAADAETFKKHSNRPNGDLFVTSDKFYNVINPDEFYPKTIMQCINRGVFTPVIYKAEVISETEVKLIEQEGLRRIKYAS